MKSPVKVTPEGIVFNIHNLKEGEPYYVMYKEDLYSVVKEGEKIVIYRMSKERTAQSGEEQNMHDVYDLVLPAPLRSKIQDLLGSITRHVFTLTFTVLVEYLTDPTPEKAKKMRTFLKYASKLFGAVKFAFSFAFSKLKIPYEPVDKEIEIATTSRTIIRTFYNMIKESKGKPEILYDPEFKRKYLEKLNELILLCDKMCEKSSSEFMFYKALLTSLSALIEVMQP